MKLSRLLKLSIVALLVSSVLYSPGSYAISSQERFYKRMNTIEKLMGDRQYNEAINRLDKLYSSYKNRKHESGLILQLYGYVYSQKGNTDKAIKYFQKCLKKNTLPASALQNIRLNLSQLWIEKKDYQKAEQMFVQWHSVGKPLLPKGFALGGVIYAYQKKYDKAEKMLKKAINTAKQPREQWYQLLLSIYLDRKNYKQAKTLLKNLVEQYPGKKQYWTRLADVSYLLKDYTAASSVMEVAKKKGLLKSEQELKKLAGFYYYAGIPYKSATTLEYAFEKKIIKPTLSSLRQQAHYYRYANDYSQAINSLKKASKLSPEPVLYYEIAQVHAAENKWKEVSNTLLQFKEAGDPDLSSKSQMLLGKAFFEQGKYERALAIFLQLDNKDKMHPEAKKWKTYTQQLIDYQK